MGDNNLKDRTQSFALRVIRLVEALPNRQVGWVLGKQLLRSGTSVGANYRAALRARSKAEFVAKMGVSLEEADETVYWLELLAKGEIMSPDKLRDLMDEAGQLVSILVASVRTAKGVEA